MESVDFTELLRKYTVFILSLGDKLGIEILFESLESGDLLSKIPILLPLAFIFKLLLCGLLDAPLDGLLSVPLGLNGLLVLCDFMVKVGADKDV